MPVFRLVVDGPAQPLLCDKMIRSPFPLCPQWRWLIGQGWNKSRLFVRGAFDIQKFSPSLITKIHLFAHALGHSDHEPPMMNINTVSKNSTTYSMCS